MAVNVGVNVRLDGVDNTKRAFESSKKSAETLNRGIADLRNSWRQTITAISTAYLALNSVMRSLSVSLRAPVNAALETEKAMSKLNASLSMKNLSASRAELVGYIGEMDKLSGAGDAMLANIAAQNALFGMNAVQIKKTMDASFALTKLTGGSMADANDLLIQSINGQIRGLQKLVPGVGALTDAQQRAGGAIDLTNDKLGRLTQNTVSEANVALSRASTLWENFGEEIVKSIAGGVDWGAAYERVVQLLGDAGQSLAANREGFGKFGEWLVGTGLDALEQLVNIFIVMAPRMDAVTEAFKQMYGAARILIIPFAELAVSAASMWAALRGDKDLAARLEVTMNILKNSFSEGMQAVTGFSAKMKEVRIELADPISIQFQSQRDQMAEARAAAEQEARDKMTMWDKAWTYYKDGLKDKNNYHAEQMKISLENDRKSLKQWVDIFQSVKKSIGFGPADAKTAPKMMPLLPMMQRAENPVAGAALPPEAAGKGGKFSGSPLTVDPQLIEKTRAVRDAIAALEKDGYSESERARSQALNAIRKLEDDARKLGIKDAKAFSDARLKVDIEYARTAKEQERRVTEMIGSEAAIRKVGQSRMWDDLLTIQKDAGAKTFSDLDRQATERIRLLGKNIDNEIELQRKREDRVLEITGGAYEKSEREYEAHLEELEKLRQEGAFGPPDSQISDDMYEQSVGKVDQARDRDKGQTSEYLYKNLINPSVQADSLQRFDNSMKDANNVVSQMQQGASGVINQIGSVFGPMGSLIASVVNLLRMAPEELSKLLDGIMQAFIDLIPNIMENIPMIFEKIALAIPDIIVSVFGTLLSVPMWVKFLTRIVGAMGDLLQGIFSQAVFGKSLRDKVNAEESRQRTQKQPDVKFGSGDPNAGEGKFKIKDVQLREGAKPAEEIQDTFPVVVEEASKNFVQYLFEGWYEFWDTFVGAWRTLWGEVEKLFTNPMKTVVGWFKTVGKWLSQMWKDLNPFSKLDVDWKGMVDTRALIDEMVAGAGEFVAALRTGMTPIWAELKDAVADMFSPVVDAFKNFVADPMTFLTDAAMGLRSFIADPLNTLVGFGDKISAFLIDTFPFLGAVADKFVLFRDATHEMLGSIADRFVAFTADNLPFLTPVAKMLSDFIHDPMQALKDAAGSLSKAFTSGVTAMTNAAGPMGAKIADGLKQAMSGLTATFSDIGWKIWNGLSVAITGNGEWLKNVGWKFWSGLSDALTSNFEWLKNVGWKFWTGLADAFKANFDWIKSIGSKIWEGIKAGLGSIASGGGGDLKKILGYRTGGDIGSSAGYGPTAALWSAMGAIRAQDGLPRVPGSGVGDKVPILAEPGERVLSRSQVKAADGAGATTVNISINVASGAQTPDRAALQQMGEFVIDYIRKESKNGRNVLRPAGVY